MAIPQGLDDCFTRYAQKTSIRHTVGQSINWICVHQFMWQQNGMHKWFNYNVTSNTNTWYSRLLAFPNRRSLTNAGTAKVRKEIRMMSDMERQKFFRAIQMLKADKVWCSVHNNRYIELRIDKRKPNIRIIAFDICLTSKIYSTYEIQKNQHHFIILFCLSKRYFIP